MTFNTPSTELPLTKLYNHATLCNWHKNDAFKTFYQESLRQNSVKWGGLCETFLFIYPTKLVAVFYCLISQGGLSEV